MTGSFDWQRESQVQWDSRAASWNEKSRNLWKNGNRKDIIPFMEKHFKKSSKIYDIGCGDGYGSYQLYKAGYDVVGMDISSEMISLAKERLPKEEVQFSQGDLIDLPFEDNSCDGVMAINSLEWIEVPAKGLSELRRIVKEDGLLCVGILGPTAGPRANSYPRLYGDKAICNTMMPWEFKQLAAEVNLEYIDGFGVYKKGVKVEAVQNLSLELKQSLTFMWVFLLRKVGES